MSSFSWSVLSHSYSRSVSNDYSLERHLAITPECFLNDHLVSKNDRRRISILVYMRSLLLLVIVGGIVAGSLKVEFSIVMIYNYISSYINLLYYSGIFQSLEKS